MEVEAHYANIQDWKSRLHATLNADLKAITDLELLLEDYHDLEVQIPHEEAALQALLELSHFWTRKVRIALGSRCGLMNEYRLRVVIQIAQDSETKVQIYPSEDEDDSNQYCICRSSDCLLKMVACDRCNEWFHVQCLLSLEEVDSLSLNQIQNQDFICPLCDRRYSQLPQQSILPPTLLTLEELQSLLEEADEMGLQSPETELLRHVISKIKQHQELVEAELAQELEILPLPELEEIKTALAQESEKQLKVQKSIEQWRERNKYIEQLYLQSLGLPVEEEKLRTKLLYFLRARDWIEKFHYLGKTDSSKTEKDLAQKFTQLLTSEGVRADMKKNESLLVPVVRVLALLFNSSGEISREVQEMVLRGGKASHARKLLTQVESKGISTFHSAKLKKLLQKYEEWAQKVKAISNTHKVKSMAFIEQLIEDGMYLYLYEDESDLLTTIHSQANKWLEDARAVIISASGSSTSKLSVSRINELLTRYDTEVSVEFKEVQKLRELRSQLPS